MCMELTTKSGARESIVRDEAKRRKKGYFYAWKVVGVQNKNHEEAQHLASKVFDLGKDPEEFPFFVYAPCQYVPYWVGMNTSNRSERERSKLEESRQVYNQGMHFFLSEADANHWCSPGGRECVIKVKIYTKDLLAIGTQDCQYHAGVAMACEISTKEWMKVQAWGKMPMRDRARYCQDKRGKEALRVGRQASSLQAERDAHVCTTV